MKKIIRHFAIVFLVLLGLTVIVTSCKKDEISLSKSEMLTAKSWKILSSKTNGVSDVIDECAKDDFLNFTASGTYTFNPGTNKCYSDDVIQSGTWALSSDEKSIIVDGSSATLVELTKSRFTILMVDVDYKYEATYTSF